MRRQEGGSREERREVRTAGERRERKGPLVRVEEAEVEGDERMNYAYV